MAQTCAHGGGRRLTRGAREDQPSASAQLGYAAFDQEKSVSKFIRKLIDRRMAEDNE